ncbi:hypothetical protein FrEUN1fDRAFT_2077 [Parafrankia sp. EUN1f]|nr:hypothetical protein FrEUN1fDRAFT_2077 [Parafrankia sp. EUN1f]
MSRAAPACCREHRRRTSHRLLRRCSPELSRPCRPAPARAAQEKSENTDGVRAWRSPAPRRRIRVVESSRAARDRMRAVPGRISPPMCRPGAEGAPDRCPPGAGRGRARRGQRQRAGGRWRGTAAGLGRPSLLLPWWRRRSRPATGRFAPGTPAAGGWARRPAGPLGTLRTTRRLGRATPAWLCPVLRPGAPLPLRWRSAVVVPFELVCHDELPLLRIPDWRDSRRHRGTGAIGVNIKEVFTTLVPLYGGITQSFALLR